MIVAAMIFAGLTLIIGGVLGFLLGQARGRMNYEERLRDAETARAALASQVAELRQALRAASPEQASGAEAGPAGTARE